jgi:hypothetical protein
MGLRTFEGLFRRRPTVEERIYAARTAREIADCMSSTGLRYERAREIVLANVSLHQFRVVMYLILDFMPSAPSVGSLRTCARNLEEMPRTAHLINLREFGL